MLTFIQDVICSKYGLLKNVRTDMVGTRYRIPNITYKQCFVLIWISPRQFLKAICIIAKLAIWEISIGRYVFQFFETYLNAGLTC